MSAPWPYEDVPHPREIQPPSWACPSGDCECHPVDATAEPVSFSVVLCNGTGERMGGARCRLLVHDVEVNRSAPYADGEGKVEVKLPREVETVFAEWAPADTPLEPEYPYRRQYYVDLALDDRDEAARRRLSNLGFSMWPSLHENIVEFQIRYDYPEPHGHLDDIEDDLVRYHDQGQLPVKQPSTEGGGSSNG